MYLSAGGARKHQVMESAVDTNETNFSAVRLEIETRKVARAIDTQNFSIGAARLINHGIEAVLPEETVDMRRIDVVTGDLS